MGIKRKGRRGEVTGKKNITLNSNGKKTHVELHKKRRSLAIAHLQKTEMG